MRLSTAKIQNATAQKKTVRLFDGGKEKRISLGVYPDVG